MSRICHRRACSSCCRRRPSAPMPSRLDLQASACVLRHDGSISIDKGVCRVPAVGLLLAAARHDKLQGSCALHTATHLHHAPGACAKQLCLLGSDGYAAYMQRQPGRLCAVQRGVADDDHFELSGTLHQTHVTVTSWPPMRTTAAECAQDIHGTLRLLALPDLNIRT